MRSLAINGLIPDIIQGKRNFSIAPTWKEYAETIYPNSPVWEKDITTSGNLNEVSNDISIGNSRALTISGYCRAKQQINGEWYVAMLKYMGSTTTYQVLLKYNSNVPLVWTRFEYYCQIPINQTYVGLISSIRLNNSSGIVQMSDFSLRLI